MKVVLARPNFDSHGITPQVGLGRLAAWLKHNGIEAPILDGLRDGLEESALAARIEAERPDAVGITCLTSFYYEAVSLARRLKARGLRCIMGGVHPTFVPYRTLLDSHADFVVCGEGEIPLLKLLENGFAHQGVRGVYTLADLEGRPEGVPLAEAVEDLDSLPLPDWAQMAPSTYPPAPIGAVARNYPVGLITTTRGCPNQCTYCSCPAFYGRRVRFRSPENVMEEIRLLASRFGCREIHFHDTNLLLRPAHVERLCRLIIDSGLWITWSCPGGVRADSVRDIALLRLMKESGCYYLALGIESASPRVRRAVRKNEDLSHARRAIALMRRAGIESGGFFILGLPGSTVQSINETIHFAVSSGLNRAQFQCLDILPGSELWYRLGDRYAANWQKHGVTRPEWLPPGVSQEFLMRSVGRAFWRFYGRPGVLWRVARMLRARQIRYLVDRLRHHHVF